ncbi:hypothetical protein KQI65_01385 [bacterium]|nr:hypothetical protein [bacterium]
MQTADIFSKRHLSRARTMTGRMLLLTAALLVLTSCDNLRFWETKETPVETASPLERQLLEVRKRATVIQGAIESLDRVDIPTFRLDGSELRIALYSQDGELRHIDERLRHDDGSTERNRYYFAMGSLFHFYGQAKKRLNPGEQPPMTADIRTRMYFNDKGNLFYSEKTVDGSEIDMEGSEVPNTMRRAAALQDLKRTAASGIIDTASFNDLLYTAISLPSQNETPLAEDEAARSEDEAALTEDEAALAGDEAALAEDAAALQEDETMLREDEIRTEKAAAEKKRMESRERNASSTSTKTTSRKRESKAAAPPPPVEKTPPPMPPPAIVPADEILIDPHTHAMLPGTLSSHRIRFQKGNTGASLSAGVSKGKHKEYVLRANRGQKMTVTLQSDDPQVFFRVFLHDGDISGQRRAWSGTLPRYDDYHIVVYRRSDAKGSGSAAYTISMGVK